MAARRRQPSPATGLVCLGVVRGARGLEGEVRIQSFTAEPSALAAYGAVRDETGGRSWRVWITGTRKGGVLARLEGVDDRTAAEALKGVRLYVPRAALPEAGPEEYYHADLLGLRVERASGGVLGTVSAVSDFGAGDVLEIVRADGGGPVMVPFTGAVVTEVDLPGGRMVIDPPPGLLDRPAAKKSPGRRRQRAARRKDEA